MTAPTWQNLRAALYTRLDGQLAHSVYSPKAPQDADGESIGPFPYVVIVQATESPFNTDGTIGSNFVVQIDGFARGSATVSVENSIAALLYLAIPHHAGRFCVVFTEKQRRGISFRNDRTRGLINGGNEWTCSPGGNWRSKPCR